jgi:DNA excision repair protein ERCC-2
MDEQKQSAQPLRLQVAVRDLVNFYHRTGNLGGIRFGSLLGGPAGTRTHQAFFEQVHLYFPGWSVTEELALQHTLTLGDLSLRVSGRADLLLQKNTAEAAAMPVPEALGLPPDVRELILEVKSVQLPLSELNPKGNPLHWAQCELYTYLRARAPTTAADALLTYGLAYVSVGSLDVQFLFRQATCAELQSRFYNICAAYAARGRRVLADQALRTTTCKSFTFPYPALREGQKALSQAVLNTIRGDGALFAEAPTGIGKTMSVLYPAVKALGHGLTDRIFYLTAKTSVRSVAEQALADMRDSGLDLRSLTLTAKETICFSPEIYCETNICPFAVGYYDRLPEALDELLSVRTVDRAAIEICARQYQLCPFELSLDIAPYCDVIIGDYNHAFDPTAGLTLIRNTQEKQTLLTDEAHNLPDRARSMFSATLEHRAFQKAGRALEQLKPELADIAAPLLQAFRKLDEEIQAGRPALPLLEPTLAPEKVLQAEDLRSAVSPAPALNQLLWTFVERLYRLLEQIEDYSLKKPILDAYFAARFFLRVCDEFWAGDYVLTVRRESGDLLITQNCLDVAERLAPLFARSKSFVFFSATLTPLSYYATNLCGQERLERVEYLSLPSPFAAEHLNLLIHPLATTFKERERTAPRLGRVLARAVQQRAVNVLIYFPSYRYLNQVLPWFKKALGDTSRRLIVQQQGMKEAARAAFLQFFHHPDDVPAVGLAVLGGIFGEGIDLAGEKLGGVICVGTGLPSVGPEREILRNYYDTCGLNGYLYAYIYPGFNKIMQAAGRLIRSERDTGYVLLIDERYLNPEYGELFPRYWHPHIAHDLDALGELLDETMDMEAD